jgi:hypothetical protein
MTESPLGEDRGLAVDRLAGEGKLVEKIGEILRLAAVRIIR